ncbi:Murein DD-endopeptidase MepM and murein hydrolase activator NlpD, contain LysM domain [Proteiniborus ethanoligenes]|uniref:Murein DD-endopeptidase MepM and murein hydrolase activator NlpD, contain LysM domain n=1 Tax=Proteiniborus ethanoligenes TaxID=415015 RepID=A0A1H3RHY4_9FIRM|nr:M23 family metallopeptidase [Proteiniborus ethanoligenes]SDZ24549.1 Murein DD-endopeptidase MepM and murein hydrolase activator NlpD, contain LysM domain [Proteiniborus ethanoligenes]
MKSSGENENHSNFTKKITNIKRFVTSKASKLKTVNMRFTKDKLRELKKIKLNKSIFNARTGIIAIVAVLFMTFSLVQYKKGIDHEIATRAFNVKLGTTEIGLVRDMQEAIKIYDSIHKSLEKEQGLEVVINEKLSFEDVHAEDEELTDKSIIEKEIKSNLTFNVVAYAININGKDFAYLGTEKQAKEIIEKIEEPFKQIAEQDGTKIEEIKIVENVEIIRREVSPSKIDDADKVLGVLQKGTDEERTHVVEKGENYWTIAQKYKISVDDLEKANPGKNPKLIHPGDEISLVVPKPYLTVATYEKQTYVEEIKFETEYEYSDKMYKDQKSVKKKGVTGKSEVVAKVEKHNGIVVAKEILKETILSQPIAQVIVQGTKEPPPKKGTGSFMMPTRGTLTSRFGKRWGKMHTGIDLAARVGTSIVAADGGTVVFAGSNGSYGLMVDIDHGGGFVTRYAHCSKLLVKKGDKVYKGQTIAAVGNTGRSTGPHLHFEVIKNGAAQNPYNYIGKEY